MKTTGFGRLLYLIPVFILLITLASFSGGNLENPPTIRPVEKGEISLTYGFEGKHPVTREKFVHGGVDIKAPVGTSVFAAASGEVTKVMENDSWGKMIVIRHDETYETLYAHLNDFSVEEGNKVTAGQVIGHVGTTGYSTGPHLHYEVRKNGERVNPADYFEDK